MGDFLVIDVPDSLPRHGRWEVAGHQKLKVLAGPNACGKSTWLLYAAYSVGNPTAIDEIQRRGLEQFSIDPAQKAEHSVYWAAKRGRQFTKPGGAEFANAQSFVGQQTTSKGLSAFNRVKTVVMESRAAEADGSSAGRLRRLVEGLRVLFPGFAFKVTAKYEIVVSMEGFGEFPFESSSDGIADAYALILEIAEHNSDDVQVFIDSPEVHFHPRLAAKCAEAIWATSKNAQVFFASHSLEIIGQPDADIFVTVQGWG